MKKLSTVLFIGVISLSLMAQQENQDLKDLKDFKDLKEQRYTKKHRSGQSARERQRPGNSENPSRRSFTQVRDMQANELKVAAASQQKMDSIRSEVFDNFSASWILSDRELFSYDSEGKMDTYVWYTYDSTEMRVLPYDKETVTYDDAGNLSEVIWLIWDIETGEWVNYGKFDYTYDEAGNLVLESISDWDPDSNEWLEGAQFESNYDESGNILATIWSYWEQDSMKLVPAYKEEFIYEDGNLSTLNEYGMQDGEWLLLLRTLYNYELSGAKKYAVSGNLIEELTQAWNSEGESWMDWAKILYSYNGINILIMEEEWEFSWTTFVLVQYWQYEYLWDADWDLSTMIERAWHEEATKGTKGTNSWQDAFKSEWTVNKEYEVSDISAAPWFFQDMTNQLFVHMPVSETVYASVGESWVRDFRQTAYYSDLGGSTGIEDKEESSLNIFPVPASETLTIHWDDSFSKLRFELYDLTGKKVISRLVDNNETLGVNHLAGGMYLYKLSNNNHLIFSGKVSIR